VSERSGRTAADRRQDGEGACTVKKKPLAEHAGIGIRARARAHRIDIPSWYALFLPKETPSAIVRKLHKATVAALETPSVQKGLIEVGSDLVPPEHRSAEYLGKFVAAEIEKWGRIITTSGVQIN